MLEIFLLIIGLFIPLGMAAHRRRRSRDFVALPFEVELDLATLADDTVLTVGLLTGNLTEDLYIISVDASWTLRAAGAAAQGPYAVGYSHGDYSATEVKEGIDASPTGPADTIQIERARRMIRKAGSFDGLLVNENLNDGKPLRTRIKFTMPSGKQLKFWVLNKSGGAQTTGNLIQLSGTIYGRWRV